MLPDRIVGNGWEVFEKTDIVLLCCGLAASFAAQAKVSRNAPPAMTIDPTGPAVPQSADPSGSVAPPARF